MGNILEIKNLNSSIDNKSILSNINLEIKKGDFTILLGPNGAGKSSLTNVLMGNPQYETKGKIIFEGKDITKLSVDDRAKLGIFMSFQHPIEVSGVTLSNFLRTSYNSIKGTNLNITEFMKILNQKLDELEMDKKFRSRFLNFGFSGGEKKRCEILQMLVLEPKFIILDEIDSGLDVDSLKLIAKVIENYKTKDVSILLITHHNKFLEYITPDKVIIMKKGEIVKQGDITLMEEILEKGFN